VRELRFKRYTMHCADGIWTQGTLKDLLSAMPYVLHTFIPPFHILNYLFRHGVQNDFFPDGFLPDGKVQYDAGMSGGCSWKPFEIIQEEYEELVLDLLTDPGAQLKVLDTPAEIKTYRQWVDWKLAHLR
jgi:hypothetical protein